MPRAIRPCGSRRAGLRSSTGAYERLWRSDASDDDDAAAFAPGFSDHRRGADGAGVDEFREHRKAAASSGRATTAVSVLTIPGLSALTAIPYGLSSSAMK